jgi:hypothetical protein
MGCGSIGDPYYKLCFPAEYCGVDWAVFTTFETLDVDASVLFLMI